MIIKILECLSFEKKGNDWVKVKNNESWKFCYVQHLRQWHLYHWDRTLKLTDIDLDELTLYQYLKETFSEEWSGVRQMILNDLVKEK